MNPVASFPIGKYNGENPIGRALPGPASFHTINQKNTP
jgi:hypothetical protein